MLLNICKNIRISLFKFPNNIACRELSNMKKILTQECITKIESEKEIEESLLIEKNLFEQSFLQHKPLIAAERLKSGTSMLNQNSIREQMLPPKTLSEMEKRRPLKKECKSQIINDKEFGFEFTKLSLTDPRLNIMMTTVRSKRRRDKNRLIVIEGRRLILDALECGLHLKTVIFSQREQLAAIKEKIAVLQKVKQTEIYKVPHHDLKLWSTLNTPPGVLAIFERPCLQYVRKTLSKVSVALPITVVCDNIRDPNNLGSIIRTCAALPCLQVVITKGCCDPWESKSLRGGCGGHFRIPIHDDVNWNEVPLVIPTEAADNCWVFIAENNISKSEGLTSVLDYTNLETGSHSVVIVGGESHGVSKEAYQFMQTVGNRGKCLHIPVAEGADSLNVASALTLILYELRKHVSHMQN
uniref:RNA 2-O ribose methyltransferase substrate binding domain-containing protein n=1 Tax=Glossina palpalis gambiensis TaxID=67801 RepID=A0A1B0C0A9_9MUSC